MTPVETVLYDGVMRVFRDVLAAKDDREKLVRSLKGLVSTSTDLLVEIRCEMQKETIKN